MNPNIALIDAVCEGDMEYIKNAISAGADDYNGALIWAAGCGRKEVLDYLIECGAKDYNSAMELAVKIGNTDIIWRLLYSGAVVNHTDQSGKTHLQNAVRRRHTKVIKQLLEWGTVKSDKADIDKAIEEAMAIGDTKTAFFLIKWYKYRSVMAKNLAVARARFSVWRNTKVIKIATQAKKWQKSKRKMAKNLAVGRACFSVWRNK